MFVRYAFEHDTTKCNEILQIISFRLGEGRRVVFNPKFLLEVGVCLTIVGFTIVNAFFREFARMIVLYIYKEESLSVCLSDLHAFGHGTTKWNEILRTILFRPEEGHDGVFAVESGFWGGFSKFSEKPHYIFLIFQKIHRYFQLLVFSLPTFTSLRCP